MCKDIFIRASPSELVSASRRYEAENSDSDSIVSKSSSTKSLKRVFRLFDLVIYGISRTVGSGIFIIAGTAGKSFAGSSLVLSLLIGGFGSMCSAFAHAEFASRIPTIGSVYTYVYNSSGEFVAFQMAWQGILDPLGASINSIGATGYFKSFLIACGINRDKFDNSIWFGYKSSDDSVISISLAAALLLFSLTILAIFGVGLSKNFMNYFTLWNISLLILFILCGSFLIDPDIWIHPCSHLEFGVECPSDANNSFFPYGIDGTLAGGLIASWAFGGFQGMVNVAEECVDPIRDIPRAIYISLLLITLLYVAVVIVVNGIVPFQAFDTEAALSESLAVHDELLLHQLISLGASSTMSVLSFASLIGSTRRWFRVGVDGLCFPIFSYIHPRFRTPFYTILLYAIVGTLTSLLFDLGSILAFASVGGLLNGSTVMVGLLIIRYSPPNHHDNDDNNEQNTTYWWNETKMIGLFWLYLLFCLIFSFIEVNRDYFKHNDIFSLWIMLIVVFGLILLGFVCLFCYFHYKYPWKQWVEKFRTYDNNNKIYYMPLSPYLPCLYILLNSYLVAGIGLQKIGYLIIILLLGVPVYFGFSYKNSTLRKQRLSKQVSSMIALTAVDNDNLVDDDANDVDHAGFNQTVETVVT